MGDKRFEKLHRHISHRHQEVQGCVALGIFRIYVRSRSQLCAAAVKDKLESRRIGRHARSKSVERVFVHINTIVDEQLDGLRAGILPQPLLQGRRFSWIACAKGHRIGSGDT